MLSQRFVDEFVFKNDLIVEAMMKAARPNRRGAIWRELFADCDLLDLSVEVTFANLFHFLSK